MLQSRNILTSNFPFSSSYPHNHFLLLSVSSSLNFLHRPNSLCSLPLHTRHRPVPWLAQVAEPTKTAETSAQEEGPIELFPSTSPIFATNDDPSSLQVATSVLLTGAISVFLFRSLRRRAKRAKELVQIRLPRYFLLSLSFFHLFYFIFPPFLYSGCMRQF